MRVLFCTTGGLGHLLPLRPLAAALRRGGHEVAWVTAPDAMVRLEGLGFDLFAAGPSFEAGRREFRAAHADGAQLVGEPLSAFTFPRLFGAVLAPAMLDGVEQAVRHWGPDFVVHEPAALAAPLVCQQPRIVGRAGVWSQCGRGGGELRCAARIVLSEFR